MVMEQMKKNSAIAVKVLLKAIPQVAAFNWAPVKKGYEVREVISLDLVTLTCLISRNCQTLACIQIRS